VETVDEVDIEVFGIQRVMKPVSNNPTEWHSYYSAEGSLLFTLLSFFLAPVHICRANIV